MASTVAVGKILMPVCDDGLDEDMLSYIVGEHGRQFLRRFKAKRHSPSPTLQALQERLMMQQGSWTRCQC